MIRKRWVLAAIVVALVILGLSVLSHAGRHCRERMTLGHRYRMNMLFDELRVTDDQRVALKKLFKEHRKDLQPAMEAVRAKGGVLRELILADSPDEAAIRQAAAELTKTIGYLAVQASTLTKEARSILTPEQVERLKEILQHRQKVFDETLRDWREQNPDLIR